MSLKPIQARNRGVTITVTEGDHYLLAGTYHNAVSSVRVDGGFCDLVLRDSIVYADRFAGPSESYGRLIHLKLDREGMIPTSTVAECHGCSVRVLFD